MNVDMVCHGDDKHSHSVEGLIRMQRLTSETVESTALSLESVDDIQRGNGLPLGVLGVCDSITDDRLKE